MGFLLFLFIVGGIIWFLARGASVPSQRPGRQQLPTTPAAPTRGLPGGGREPTEHRASSAVPWTPVAAAHTPPGPVPRAQPRSGASAAAVRWVPPGESVTVGGYVLP